MSVFDEIQRLKSVIDVEKSYGRTMRAQRDDCMKTNTILRRLATSEQLTDVDELTAARNEIKRLKQALEVAQLEGSIPQRELERIGEMLGISVGLWMGEPVQAIAALKAELAEAREGVGS